MRETIAYSKDYRDGSYFEQIKMKPDGIRNKVTALLYDEDGKLIKEEFTENIIQTNKLDLIHYINTFFPIIANSSGSKYTVNTAIPSARLVLTDYAGAENADNKILRGNMLAYANKSGSNITPTSNRGYMNVVESQKISESKYKYVFDFPQTCANGTFQSLWFADNCNMVQELVELGYTTLETSYSYGSIICESDGYWFINAPYIKKYSYANQEYTDKRISLRDYTIYNGANTYALSSYTQSYLYGSILHICSDGKYLITLPNYFSNSIIKLDPATKTGTVLTCTFNDIGSVTYVGDYIYWFCRYSNVWSLCRMKVADLEAATTLTGLSSDKLQIVDICTAIKNFHSYSSVPTVSNVYEWKVCEFEGKLWLSAYANGGAGQCAYILNPNTLAIEQFAGSSPYRVDTAKSNPNMDFTTTSVHTNEYCTNISKWLNDGVVLLASGSICSVIPPISHAKLPSPITKDSSQSMKIIYEFEVLMPSDYLGTIKSTKF